MPQPFWRHLCETGEVWLGSPDCATCGDPGVFDGWGLSMWEKVAIYRYVYGLNPFGPHRPLADHLFAGMRDPCVRCGGRTVLTLGDGSAWNNCPTCEGTGGVWNRPFEDIDAVWQEVVAHFPEAATREPPAPHRGTEARRRKGYSSHGLRFTDVQRAFARAERLLGTAWQLKGPGHCRRVSLDARYSTHAINGAARSWAWVTPFASPRRLLPLAIVEKAAKMLGVPARLLISREF